MDGGIFAASEIVSTFAGPFASTFRIAVSRQHVQDRGLLLGEHGVVDRVRFALCTIRAERAHGRFAERGGMESGQEIEFIEDVVEVHDEFRALLDERVASRRGRIVRLARHGEHMTALFQRLRRGDQ